MARPRKMITEADISKNSSIKITGTINKIKANERKYTIYLVIIFMILFILIGYFTLSVNLDKYNEQLKKESITLKSKTLVLDEDDVLSDQDGLNTKNHVITLHNGTKEKVKYKILLQKDETLTSLCDCGDDLIKASDLRLSFVDDIVTYNNFEDMIIDIGEIKANETKNIKIKVWLSEDTNTHFHGRFILEKID